MKQIISLSLILFSVLLVNQSCSKESLDKMAPPPNNQIIKAYVSPNSVYVLNVSSLESVSINKQAAHFTISQTENDAKNGTPVYKYIPEKNYAGTDEVVLRTTKTIYTGNSEGGCSGSGGNVNHTSIAYSDVTIKFTVIQ